MNFTYLRKNVRFPRFLVVLVRTQKKEKRKNRCDGGMGIGDGIWIRISQKAWTRHSEMASIH